MIFDTTLLFSDAQAVTATAPSTNIIDLGATGTVYGAAAALTRDVGKGQDVPIDIQVVEGFNNLTSLTVTIQTDDNVPFASPRDLVSMTLSLAQLAAGAVMPVVNLPRGVKERYLRLNYTVTGTAPTLGKITAGIVAGVQSNGIGF